MALNGGVAASLNAVTKELSTKCLQRAAILHVYGYHTKTTVHKVMLVGLAQGLRKVPKAARLKDFLNGRKRGGAIV